MSKIVVSHDPRECRKALAGADAPVVIDLETTGLRRHDAIVSAGVLVRDVAHILFVGSRHASIRNVSPERFREAMEPLTREDLILVGHNVGFDLGFLLRAGFPVAAQVHDTLKILRLLDQDRGGDKAERRRPRIDLRAPVGARMILLNYKLKDAVAQLLAVRLLGFPGSMLTAPYAVHTRYLASDLLGTRLLYQHLWPQLTGQQRDYHQRLVAPLTPLLVEMTHRGTGANPDFIRSESDRLEELMADLSTLHQQRHGLPLGMDAKQMSEWLFGAQHLGLPLPDDVYRPWGRRKPRLDAEAIESLLKTARAESLAAACHSLELIQDYRRAASLMVRLRSLLKHVDRRTGRIHSTFDDRQATGRLSSTYPNLQQLAKARIIADKPFVSRDALVASPGCELVDCDISQADIRVLAHAVESFRLAGADHLRALRRERWALLQQHLDPYRKMLASYRNPEYEGESQGGPEFSPAMESNLAKDFRESKDIYAETAKRMLGRLPSDAERDRFKPLVLGTVNGQGPTSLAKAMGCSKAEAEKYLEKFQTLYGKETAFTELMYGQIALTGETATFLGRTRTDTPHRWLVREPLCEILVSYRKGDAYWVEIVPLEPSRRVLTTFVLRAWDARISPRRLIYDHRRGRLTGRPYRLFEDDELLYRLPARNWGWRSIRRVRAKGEEAQYQGLDATCRALFNHICQAGTADVTKLMMLRSQDACRQFDARLLMQIHDELVFEVPQGRVEGFIRAVQPVLEAPPCADFLVPIKVKIEHRPTFGKPPKPRR